MPAENFRVKHIKREPAVQGRQALFLGTVDPEGTAFDRLRSFRGKPLFDALPVY
jgi:hypothetical protein